MKLAVSNIAWAPAEETAVAEQLQKLGVTYVEIAPTKVWDDPLQVTDQQIADYQTFWGKYGIEVVAFQSMLFPHPELKIFESAANRAETLAKLKEFIVLAGKMKAGILVFGSPKNRQRGDLSKADADVVAKEFFAELGDAAQKNGVRFCIEPNAPQYSCDFVTTAGEGVELVAAVNNPGFGLHLDAACMTMAGDDPHVSIVAAKDWLQHFHISAPMLGEIEEIEVQHQVMADSLREIGYDGFVSIEMRPGDEGQGVDRVTRAVAIANKYYV